MCCYVKLLNKNVFTVLDFSVMPNREASSNIQKALDEGSGIYRETKVKTERTQI